MKTTKFLSVAAVAVAATVALAGCSTGGSGSGGSDSAAASCKPSSGKVTLDFTTWVPNMDKVVDIWNKENPDIQVKVSIVANGNSGTYQNFFNQLKAKQAPDIGQVEYDTLPPSASRAASRTSAPAPASAPRRRTSPTASGTR